MKTSREDTKIELLKALLWYKNFSGTYKTIKEEMAFDQRVIKRIEGIYKKD